MRTTVYYVKCGDRVYFVSGLYHEAVAYRDEMAAASVDQPGMCRNGHVVNTQEVTFL